VARGIGLDKRIGSKFLHGPGYGGSAFRRTPGYIQTAQDHGRRSASSRKLPRRDQRKPHSPQGLAAGGTDEPGIAVLGLTLKPNTDDTRYSPAISIITALQDAGARINAFDPEGMDQARLILDGLTFFFDPYSCCDKADALVIVTEWDAFRALDLDRVKSALAAPVMIDLRNIYDPEDMARRGFVYSSVGRGASYAESRRE
jgi:UDPglucose 6-dehydrogenase